MPHKIPWHHGFTLVELIITIVILTILGTISFLSFQGYSASARDSQRISDLGNIRRILELYQNNTNSYPSPDNSFSVTYNSGVLWKQGAIGANLVQRVNTIVNGGINPKPIDPLSGKEYTYSSLVYGKGYELMASLENTTSFAYQKALIPGIDTVYAAPESQSAIAYITGNYNGLIATTTNNGILYLLAIPSIITNTGSAGHDVAIELGYLSGTLLINGAASGLSYDPSKPSSLIYSGTTLPKDNTGSGITNIIKNLQTAYTDQNLASNSNIKQIYSFSSSNEVPSGCVILSSVGGRCTNDALSGNSPVIPTHIEGTEGGETPTGCIAYVPSNTYSSGQCFTYNGSTITVTGSGIGTVPTTTTCDTPDIAIWGSAGIQIWAACNAGGDKAYSVGVDIGPTLVSCSTDDEGYTSCTYAPFSGSQIAYRGGSYQWGRNDDVSNTTSYTSKAYTGTLIDGAAVGNTNYIYQGYGDIPASYDWYAPEGGSGTNATRWNTNRQGPCQSGYHVPTNLGAGTNSDWPLAAKIINGTDVFTTYTYDDNDIATPTAVWTTAYRTKFQNTLRLHKAGGYWSSSPTTAGKGAMFGLDSENILNSTTRYSRGFVRCIRN